LAGLQVSFVFFRKRIIGKRATNASNSPKGNSS
jgi:hypothetical protein